MRTCIRFFVVASVSLVVASSLGCGAGVSQRDMMRHAIRRPSDDDDSPPAKDSQQPPRPTAGENVSPASNPVAKGAPTPAAKQQTRRADAAGASATDSAHSDVAAAYQDPPTPGDPGAPLSAAESQRRAVAKLSRIGTALEEYAKIERRYPTSAIQGSRNEPLLSWRVALLPYLGHAELHARFKLDEPWNSQHNQPLVAEIPPVFASPEAPRGETTLLVPVGSSTAYSSRIGIVPRKIEDGAENTVILLEANPELSVPWTAPEDYRVRLDNPHYGVGTQRAGGFLVVWGGGVVNWVDLSTPTKMLKAMYTIDAGEGIFASQIGVDPLAALEPVTAHTPLADDRAATPASAASSTPAIPPAQRGDASSSPLASLGGPDVPRRQAVPADAALMESKELLRDLYQQEYLQAGTLSARQSLAKRMLDQLKEIEADVAGQYALLDTVRQMSIQAGEVETALRAVDELTARFEIDGHDTRLMTLSGLSRSAAGRHAATIVTASVTHCQEAFAAEKYDVADDLCGVALAAARTSRDAAKTAALTQLRQEILAAKQLQQLAKRALETLDDDPSDPRASLVLGKYLCLVRQDWMNGLTILARADDTRLSPLAQRELERPSGAEMQASLGDDWWRVAEKEELGERRAMFSRAAHWYRLAAPNLQPGLARVKIESRLRQLDQWYGAHATSPLGFALGGPR